MITPRHLMTFGLRS